MVGLKTRSVGVRTFISLLGLGLFLGQPGASYETKPGQKEFMTADEFLEMVKFDKKSPIPKGEPSKGRPLYVVHCAPCHGLTGDGSGLQAAKMDPKPRDHTDGEYMNKRSNEHLIKVIKLGGPGVRKSAYMPAFGHLFSEEDIWNLVAYLRAIAKPSYSER